MANLSALSNDQLQAETRERLVEIERRLESRPRLLRRALKAHALLSTVEKELHAKGQVSALSIGGDKGD